MIFCHWTTSCFYTYRDVQFCHKPNTTTAVVPIPLTAPSVTAGTSHSVIVKDVRVLYALPTSLAA